VATTLTGAALTLLAFMFDAAPLFVPALALVLLGGCTLAWVWLGVRGARIQRRLYAERVLEGEALQTTIEVRRGRLRPPTVEVSDPLSDAPVRLKRSEGGSAVTIRFSVRFHRRGRRRLPPPSIALSDPLGLARARRSSAQPVKHVLVLPRTGRVCWSEGGGRARSGDPAALAPHELLAAVEVDGLRPYRRGTPASRIHWPALARGAGVLERHLVPEEDARPLVILDARGSGPTELLDAAVRAAASLALALAAGGGCALLLPGERRPMAIGRDLAAWPAAHAGLAMVQAGPPQPAPVLARAPLGTVLYVAAMLPEPLPRALLGGGGGSGVLVLPACLTAGTGHSQRPQRDPQPAEHPRLPRAPSFEVSGCCGFVLARGAPGRHAGRPSGHPAGARGVSRGEERMA